MKEEKPLFPVGGGLFGNKDEGNGQEGGSLFKDSLFKAATTGGPPEEKSVGLFGKKEEVQST